jgi:23S rRNA (guanosine2251-2'-O)-methyltransferase
MAHTRLIFGFHPVTARLRRDPASIERILLRRDRADARAEAVVRLAETAGVPVETGDSARLDDATGHRRHQGVVAWARAPKPIVDLDELLDSVEEPAFLLVLDGVTDPHNLGACLRSADAFGVHAIVVPKDRAVGVNATVAKVASGAADTVPVIAVTNLARVLRQLKARGVWLVGADADGPEPLFEAALGGPIAWILGAEGAGMRRLTRELCDRVVAIPLMGSVSSLNVSVAAAICLYATRQQRAKSASSVE